MKKAKLYFAKYIPQEREIKAGDKFIALKDTSTKGMILICDYLDDSLLNYSEPVIRYSRGVEPSENFYQQKDTQLVKLCLCSRNIQIGDKNVWLDGCTKVNIDNEENLRVATKTELTFKVIGEISPDALGYVREGDEFDEDQVMFIGDFTPDYEPDDYRQITEKQYLSKRKIDVWEHKSLRQIQIKGPCGHFH